MKTLQQIWIAAAFLFLLSAQDQEPVVLKDAISVHMVQRGNMPILERAAGSITSLQPPRAVVTLSNQSAERCKIGQKASTQIAPRKVITGRVVTGRCEIEFSEPFAGGAAVGAELGALVEVGEMRDVVFFARPADSSADSEASVFVIEPGDQHARRISVHYGKLSGPPIQIVSGLSPGDRVIVTDMSKWIANLRVRLQ
jgi:hypothetical protein